MKIYFAEMDEIISSNFASASDAFVFFARHGPTRTAFNNSCFKRAVNTLLPKRFSNKELDLLWNRLTGSAVRMNRSLFLKYFMNTEFDGCLSLTGSKVKK